MCRNNELVKTAPCRNSRFRSTRFDDELRLLRFCSMQPESAFVEAIVGEKILTLSRFFPVDLENGNSSGVTHTLLSDGQHPRVVLTPLNALDGCWELPGVEALSRSNVPHLEHVVGRSRHEVVRGSYTGSRWSAMYCFGMVKGKGKFPS